MRWRCPAPAAARGWRARSPTSPARDGRQGSPVHRRAPRPRACDSDHWGRAMAQRPRSGPSSGRSRSCAGLWVGEDDRRESDAWSTATGGRRTLARRQQPGPRVPPSREGMKAAGGGAGWSVRREKPLGGLSSNIAMTPTRLPGTPAGRLPLLGFHGKSRNDPRLSKPPGARSRHRLPSRRCWRPGRGPRVLRRSSRRSPARARCRRGRGRHRRG
jgi:hypothetical protein